MEERKREDERKRGQADMESIEWENKCPPTSRKVDGSGGGDREGECQTEDLKPPVDHI